MKKVFFISVLSILLFICGCDHQTDATAQRLLLSAVPNMQSSRTFTQEELNGNFDGSRSLLFQNIENVTITLGKKNYPLETAIADGLITVEEIEAYARIDARNGFCTVIADSHNGISRFIYRYDGVCDIYFTHDVYETPDGSNPIMTYFAVCNNNGLDNTFYKGGTTLYSVLDQNYPIDMEDWKLNFEITDISPSGFTLHVNQASNTSKNRGSQQVGQLQLVEFELYDLNDLSKPYVYPFNREERPITEGTGNSFKITFAEVEGFPAELPSGNYRMYLVIMDDFDEADVHPFMRDYHQFQGYWVNVDIS